MVSLILCWGGGEGEGRKKYVGNIGFHNYFFSFFTHALNKLLLVV